MPKRTDLLHSLPVVAKALGRKYGLSVEVGGTQAFTDGNTIHLPSLPPDDRGAGVLAYGFLDHEAGHVRLTDFEVLSAAKSPLHKALFNILEDIRVELEMGRIFPGCKINLNSLIGKLAVDHFFGEPTPKDSPASILQAFLLFNLRVRVLGQTALIPLAQTSEALLCQIISAQLVARLSGLVTRVGRLASTKDSMILAGEILELLQREVERPPAGWDSRLEHNTQPESETNHGMLEPEGSANHSTPVVPSDTQGSTSVQPSTQAEGHRSEDKQRKECGKDGNSDPGESPPSADGGLPVVDEGSCPLKPSGGKKPKVSQSRILKRILQSTEAELSRDFGEMLADRLAHAGEQACKEGYHMAVTVSPSPAVSSAIMQEVSQQNRALRVKLDGLIQASRLDRARLAATGLRINTGELYRLALSDPQVFSRLRKRKAVNTAVQILLDKSGSMRDRLEVARRAALSVACALEPMRGTAVACAAFPIAGGRNSVGILPLTRFEERVPVTASRYESLTAQGGTPLAEALWWCASEIMGRKEERKMILVVTDGQPDDTDSTREIIQRCLHSGIEMIGLGIQVQAVGALLPDWCVIQGMDQLAPAMFQVLERKLTYNFAHIA